MGSSKKKHKKDKDRERHRSKSKFKSHSLSQSYDAAGMVKHGSDESDQVVPLDAKPPSLRLVLKVPPSAYSQPITSVPEDLPVSSPNPVSYLSPPTTQSQSSGNQSFLSPDSISKFPQNDPLSTISFESISALQSDDFEYPNAPDGSLTSGSLHKKSKKSKSKKSKHHKRSHHSHHSHSHSHKHHSHKHHHHSHRKHRHHSTASTSAQQPDWMSSQSLGPPASHSVLPHGEPESSQTQNQATLSDLRDTASSQFGEPQTQPLKAPSSVGSEPVDYLANLVPEDINSQQSSQTTPEPPPTQFDSLFSETVTSTTNAEPISPLCAVPEIKLKLSKNLATSQYSATLTSSPMHAPQSSYEVCLGSTSAPQPSPPSPTIASSNTGTVSISLQTTAPPSTSTVNTTAPSSIARIRARGERRSRRRRRRAPAAKNLKDLLMHLLKQLNKKDSHHFFFTPVTDDIAPGYSTIITHPMDMSKIRKNIESSRYRNLGDFKADVKLMCDNAMRYNRPETVYYKHASKLWHFTASRLFKKEALVSYAKSYSSCSPLELSITPSEPPTSRAVTTATSAFANPPAFVADVAAPVSHLESQSDVLSQSTFDSYFTGTEELSESLPSFQFDSEMFYAPDNGNCEYPDALTEDHQPEPSFAAAYYPTPVPETKSESAMTPEELIASIKESARMAAERLRQSRRVPKISYLKYNEANNEITLNTLPTGDVPASSKPVSISNLIPLGRERIVKSFVTEDNKKAEDAIEPTATDTEKVVDAPAESAQVEGKEKEEEDAEKQREAEVEKLRQSLLSTVYEEETNLNYALSISRFARDQNAPNRNLVARTLNKLTFGKHQLVRKQFEKLLLY